MRPTGFALLAAVVAAQNPCALECRRQTCSSLNNSFSCGELSGLGCDCVSGCVLKPQPASAHCETASFTYALVAHARTDGLLRRRAAPHLPAAAGASRGPSASGGAASTSVATGPAVAAGPADVAAVVAGTLNSHRCSGRFCH